MPVSAVFLDRDGLINVPPPPEDRYVLHPDGFHLMPGIAEAIALLNRARIPVAVVTNQKGVATGRLSLDTLQRIHARMDDLLAVAGARLDAVAYCPHQESDHCACRKPLPGMILQLADTLRLHLPDAWMIGDQPRDIHAGKAAGCHTLLVGHACCPEAEATLPDTSFLPQWVQKKLLS